MFVNALRSSEAMGGIMSDAEHSTQRQKIIDSV
jgi:hypothetical protein